MYYYWNLILILLCSYPLMSHQAMESEPLMDVACGEGAGGVSAALRQRIWERAYQVGAVVE